MKIVIDIPETVYEVYKEWHKNKVATVEQSIIANGAPYEEKPQGEWKALTYHTCYCTNCHFDFDIMKCDFMTKMKFCPNCGAEMRKETEND